MSQLEGEVDEAKAATADSRADADVAWEQSTKLYIELGALKENVAESDAWMRGAVAGHTRYYVTPITSLGCLLLPLMMKGRVLAIDLLAGLRKSSTAL
jgi:hypothetical protein